ncbi:hypothetical protein BDZ85DRAFT_33223 [Elsinoe ampelina]|uniref:Cytochrome P450 n=1 Tax=Elsinoe ampelina TaxID=302913 RepID=A0A6A6G455_9PEZI|nr:hypothetical protein BDZ85DRAFT_33223 [Elsinoe ampelina]
MAAGVPFPCLNSLFRIVNIYTAICILQFSPPTTDIFNAKLLLALTIVLDVLQVNDIDFSGTHVVVYALSGWVLDKIHCTEANHQAMRNMLQECVQAVSVLINLMILIAKRTAVRLGDYYQEGRQTWYQHYPPGLEDGPPANDQAPEEHPVLPTQSTQRLISSDPAQCTQLLAGRRLTLNNGDIISNDLDPYKSRAITNERLVTAFGIGNCFVVDQKKVCEEFRKKANTAVKKTDAEWATLSETLKESLAAFIQAGRNEAGEGSGPLKLKLVPKVQALCLKIVLVAFKGVMSLASVDMDDAFFYDLAEEINEVWIASKNAEIVDYWCYDSNERLRGLMDRLMPSSDSDGTTPQTTPLNYILPGYETLWRVVLRCFLEVCFRPTYAADDKALWRQVLVAFANDPSTALLDDNSAGVSAAWISKEALRLYPPTRRIYRHFQTEEHNIEAAADIEAIHRQVVLQDDGHVSSVWGTDPSVFRPGRWADITAQVENENFLAFGTKPFICVARKGSRERMSFGVAMVGLVVGVLIGEMGPDTWLLELHDDELRAWQAGELMGTGREDYGSACVVGK